MEEPPAVAVAEGGKVEPIGVISDKKKWNRFIPFTAPWKERRKARKTGAEMVLRTDGAGLEETAILQQEENQSYEQQEDISILQPEAQTQTTTITATQVTEPGTQPQTKQKILAHYPLHDNKGAVGSVPPRPSPDRPYPVNSNVKGQKVLAQYAMHDNKGAVGWKAPTPSPDRPYPLRQYVKGHKVLAQYGHHDDKWAVKHPVY